MRYVHHQEHCHLLLDQINFVVPQPPAGTQACSGAVQSNLTVSVGGLTSFDGAGICAAPPE